MNGDGVDDENNVDQDSSDEEVEQRVVSLQERRRKYYEDRKRKMAKRDQPMNFNDMLESSESTQHTSLESQKKFLNVKIHTRLGKTATATFDDPEDIIQLKCEVEIADFVNFGELITKAINVFNNQLSQNYPGISISNNNNRNFKLRYAKKDGMPDMNFPAFDEIQRVSESGVTNLSLILDEESILYPQEKSMKKVGSTVSDLDKEDTISSQLKRKSSKEKSKGKNKEIKERDMNRMNKENSS